MRGYIDTQKIPPFMKYYAIFAIFAITAIATLVSIDYALKNKTFKLIENYQLLNINFNFMTIELQNMADSYLKFVTVANNNQNIFNI